VNKELFLAHAPLVVVSRETLVTYGLQSQPEQQNMKGPATPAVPPPPALAQPGMAGRDAADASRRQAAKRTGIQQTILAGSQLGGGSSTGTKTILGG
jgi:hypothetical protein